MFKKHQQLLSHKQIKKFLKDMINQMISEQYLMIFQLKFKSIENNMKPIKKSGSLKFNQYSQVVQLLYSSKELHKIQNVASQEHYYKFLKIIKSNLHFMISLMINI